MLHGKASQSISLNYSPLLCSRDDFSNERLVQQTDPILASGNTPDRRGLWCIGWIPSCPQTCRQKRAITDFEFCERMYSQHIVHIVVTGKVAALEDHLVTIGVSSEKATPPC